VYVYLCICTSHVYDVYVDIQGVMRVSCYHDHLLHPPGVSKCVICIHINMN